MLDMMNGSNVDWDSEATLRVICEYCTAVYSTVVVPIDEKGVVRFCIIRKLNE